MSGGRLKVAVAVLLALVIGVGAWATLAFRPTSEARAALANDSRVEVVYDRGVYRFSSMSFRGTVPVGLLLFPDKYVDPIAYAPYARAIAAAGYPVILVPLTSRGMFGGADPAEVLHLALGSIHEDERAAQWILAGHGHGASVAGRMALEVMQLGAKAVGGILLIGTAQPGDSVLAKVKVPLTKIVATKDGRVSYATAEANRRYLPPQAKWVAIDGGNHSQFASAGFFPGDSPAGVSHAEQQQRLINATLEMLRVATDTQRNASWLAR